ncbi:serine/threonine protein kinase [Clostridium polyendosporum]|uniref:Serine/threonine protein kinase n=1 Tax=Clostridium polyendosporum TaxID=69208 RepID=A0A919S1U5_9CLOT|nr:serine/threonine protein kinase [Clostridium polyendosporum]GIM29713.1 serine/threonine protein kinase [Clostridium polyendosporum]
MNDITNLIDYIDNNLLPNIDIESVNPFNPIIVNHIPKPWILLGVGNYAAGLTHPDFPEYVVKLYAPGRPGIKEEVEVYNIIKKHPSFSECFYHTENYLILKRFKGETLYSCINKGIQIPEQVINDIDEALKYARSLGLHPHDVHAKNVMIVKGRGVVVDISDFTKIENCSLWEDFKKAYYKIYLPFFYKSHPTIPEFFLNIIRRSYRLFKIILK